jgi:hypothetical protein
MQGCTQGGLPGCSPHQTTKTKIQQTDFTDIISKILCDFLFSQNQPLKLADD